ncbi:MAG: hypothetical protein ACOX3U_07885 [Christensenellales bacterium]|jgi:hypothetical protein
MEERIVKNPLYKIEESESDVRQVSNSYADFSSLKKGIRKNLNYIEYLNAPESAEIPSIDEYYEEQKRKKLEAEAEEIRKREEEKKIEEPVDLTYTENKEYMPIVERRVSYRRTFGITASRKKDIDKYTTIGLLTLCGILAIVSFVLSNIM